MTTTTTTLTDITTALAKRARADKAAFLPQFFKTGPGQYGEGDQFLGVVVPNQRKVAREFYKTTSLETIDQLLASPWHEHRLTALFILVKLFQSTKSEAIQKEILQFYLSHTDRVNNWDLVDSSAHLIVGAWVVNHPQDFEVMKKLSRSRSLWENRIAMVGCWTLIKAGRFDHVVEIATQLLHHPHDLMHKAVGWMLRELGKQDQPTLLRFLDDHAAAMPRTALRYALERLSPDQKKHYMTQKTRQGTTT